ncbi:hypothetical protein [Erythrobacter sp.]|uniref:hypothetical protein n=1 Tax=Erythrobacter sp. TaxID=1042 RepID=UPI00142602A8|nr:hypothetical protein [Erythrobacter sp.]QIQ85787.1 MAG: hypothetical protein G9473_03100 [Erythrobacter sp.]
MSIAFVFFLGLSLVALASWIAGVSLRRLRSGWTAIVSGSILLVPGLLLFFDAPVHLVGIDGEEIYGFAMLGAVTMLLGMIALTIALIIRSKIHLFGIIKEE